MSATTALDRTGPADVAPWRATLSGLCASLVGLGLARFAYTPLLPAIIAAKWFNASTAAYLGAANLAGYLAGALIAAPLAAHWPARTVLRAMMALTTLALLACAWPVSFGWFFGWRFVSGITGGTLMVLAAPTVLPHIAPARRGLASGAIFMGVGLGIAASGTLVPLLLGAGLTQAWLGLALLALLLSALAWGGWPAGAPAATVVHRAAAAHLPTRQLRALYASYALNAAGLVPHMIFLVVFVARGLGQGVAAGAQYWVAFGLGAVAGPVLGGHLADRIGFRSALRLAFALQALAVAIPMFSTGTPALIVSSVVMGAFTPGIVPLVLGRTQELLRHHPAAQKAAWSHATTAFAVLQAVAAYGMSYLLGASGGRYSLLFGLGAVAVAVALVVDLVTPAPPP
ncbi:MAG TPA: YbfB/YjiJ family MFS transporter [Burkholderiaceae bacterium]